MSREMDKDKRFVTAASSGCHSEDVKKPSTSCLSLYLALICKLLDVESEGVDPFCLEEERVLEFEGVLGRFRKGHLSGKYTSARARAHTHTHTEKKQTIKDERVHSEWFSASDFRCTWSCRWHCRHTVTAIAIILTILITVSGGDIPPFCSSLN
jgi:hypothetical protein